MDGRDAFLTLARDKHYEFSSLRRAQFSTMCMLYELHNQGQDKFVYTCNNCKNHVETRYHCTVCDVRILFHISPLFESEKEKNVLINSKIQIFFFHSSLRITICVFHAKRRLVIRTKWNVLVSTWTMDHLQPMVDLNRIHKKQGNNQSRDVFSHWFTLVSAEMQIVDYHHVRR